MIALRFYKYNLQLVIYGLALQIRFAQNEAHKLRNEK